MDIKEYRYLLTVIECGGISKAAEKLNISQPSLSKYIQNLEARLGVKFFNKSDGIIHLTYAGRRYFEYAEKISNLDLAITRELENIKNKESGEVLIGVTVTRGSVLLPKILPLLNHSFPKITFKITEGTSEILEEKLIQRKIDFAFLNLPFHKHNLEYTELEDEKIVITMNKKHTINNKAELLSGYSYKWIDINLLGNEDFILLKKGQRMRQIADDIFKNCNFKPNIKLETGNAITAYNLSSIGYGISFITAGYCRMLNNPDIVYYSVGDPPLHCSFVIAFPSENELSETAFASINKIMEIYKS